MNLHEIQMMMSNSVCQNCGTLGRLVMVQFHGFYEVKVICTACGANFFVAVEWSV